MWSRDQKSPTWDERSSSGCFVPYVMLALDAQEGWIMEDMIAWTLIFGATIGGYLIGLSQGEFVIKDETGKGRIAKTPDEDPSKGDKQ